MTRTLDVHLHLRITDPDGDAIDCQERVAQALIQHGTILAANALTMPRERRWSDRLNLAGVWFRFRYRNRYLP